MRCLCCRERVCTRNDRSVVRIKGEPCWLGVAQLLAELLLDLVSLL